jgi:hypothetical protein
MLMCGFGNTERKKRKMQKKEKTPISTFFGVLINSDSASSCIFHSCIKETQETPFHPVEHTVRQRKKRD